MEFERSLFYSLRPLLYTLVIILYVSDFWITRLLRKKYDDCDIWMYRLNYKCGFGVMMLAKTFVVFVCLFFSPAPYGTNTLGGFVIYIGCTTAFIIEFVRFLNKRKKEMKEGKSTEMEPAE